MGRNGGYVNKRAGIKITQIRDEQGVPAMYLTTHVMIESHCSSKMFSLEESTCHLGYATQEHSHYQRVVGLWVWMLSTAWSGVCRWVKWLATTGPQTTPTR